MEPEERVSPDALAAVVLCGGRSARMGRPKALLPWGGLPLIAHLVRSLGEIAEEVVVVSSPELELPPLPNASVRVVLDRAPGLGPLGGIREGLHAIESDRALVTGTDTPFVDAAFVRALAAAGDPTGSAACVLGDYVQPFPALYARALAPLADELIAAGRMRPLFLLEAGDYRRVDGEPWRERGVFDSFNTPAEYLAAVARAGARAPVRLLCLDGTEVETAPGMLRELVGRHAPEALSLPDAYVTLAGRMVTDLELPVGPGEHVVVCRRLAAPGD